MFSQFYDVIVVQKKFHMRANLNVLLLRWFDLVRHGYGTETSQTEKELEKKRI